MLFPLVTAGSRHDLRNRSVFNRQLPGEFTLHLRLSRIHRQLSEPDTRLLFLLNAFFLDKKSRCALWYNMNPELSIPFFTANADR